MIVAFVLLAVKPGSERAISKKLLELKPIVETNILFGEYDIIAKIQVKDKNELQTFIIENIRSLQDVEQSSTLISTDSI